MKVCRLCLSKLQRGSKYFNINAVESFTGFMPYRDQLTTCIPEMALDLIPNPVICNSCRTALKSSYDFKSRCLMIEKKIREYVEAQPPEVTMYDLNEIDGSDIPKLNTKFQISPEPQAAPGPPPLHPYSKLSELLTTNKDVMLPFQNKELEITNVTDNFSGNSTFDDSFDLTTCNVCMIKFDTVPALHQHKKDVHNEDYICNFCNESFRSLQCLRKHNYDCMKNKSPANRTTVLAKRPHLPTKAKNHLKRWLFRHTEHPYPTDHEKQQLMKETNLSLLQVENWFINARRRILADLTKLKNMRGRHIKRKRQDKDNNGDEDCEDLLDNDPDPLFEESFLFETESTPPRRGRAVRGRRRKIIPQPRPIPRKQPVSLPDNKDEEEAQAPKAPEEEETEEEEEMTARSTQELDGPPGLMRIKRENEVESIKLKEEHIDDEEEDIQEEEEEVQNEEEDKVEEEDEEEMPLTKIKMELEAGR